MFPIQISSAMIEPVASIFMPRTTTPSSSSRTTRQLGVERFCFSQNLGSRAAWGETIAWAA
jgi:hypothetical protein